tara:strand:+ start:64 stop:165 length:102 start_codon:yes stop_codon:yes gene_type:complete
MKLGKKKEKTQTQINMITPLKIKKLKNKTNKET